MPDHGGVFSSLAARLRARVSRYVAVLEPASCGSVQATVRAMVRQLTSAGEVRDVGWRVWSGQTSLPCRSISEFVARNHAFHAAAFLIPKIDNMLAWR